MARIHWKVICCVPGCSTTSLSNKSFFSAPADDRRDEWLRLINREDLKDILPNSKKCKVCEDHFSNDNFLFRNKRKTLKKSALPSLGLPILLSNVKSEIKEEVHVPEATSSKSIIYLASKLTQTDIDSGNEIERSNVTAGQSSVEDRYLTDLKNKFYYLCNKHLTKDLATLIQADDSLTNNYITSNKDEFSQFCFNLYQQTPQATQLFQRIYNLPKIDVLLKQYVKIGTKIDDTVMLTMKSRVDKMSVRERNCSVLIESVKVKANLCYNIKEDKIYGFQEINGAQSTEPATKAIAVMIRGLFFNWKLPIGFIFIHQNYDENLIQNWMTSLIKSLFEIGLNVRGLVSSTKDDWINSIICGKSISVDAPYFLVNDKKIYHIFDAPDLVISARDCILLHDIHFQNKVAKYEDIINFYKADKEKSLPYAHKLTNSHIYPKNKEKQEVKYAVELMSRTVANGLWTYKQFDFINNANEGTAEFISNMNDLFDILNVSHKNHYVTECKRAFCENKFDKDVFKEMLFFQDLKIVDTKNGQDVTSSTKFVKCILITLKSISLLLDDLKTEGNNVLLTRHLHLDALHDYINKLTSRIKGKPTRPTTLQFTVAFKKCFLSNLKKFTQRGNTKYEVTNFVTQISHLKKNEDENTVRHELCSVTPKDLNTELEPSMASSIKISNPRSIKDDDSKLEKLDYDILDTPEKHSLLYMSGYLLMMVKKNHDNCDIFRHYLCYRKFDYESKFQRYNQYMQNKKLDLPAQPCDKFIQFVEEMDAKFVQTFLNKHLSQRTVDSLIKDIEEIDFTTPCFCFPKKYAVTLFIRIKILYMIRINNKLFKDTKRHKIFLTVPRLDVIYKLF